MSERVTAALDQQAGGARKATGAAVTVMATIMLALGNVTIPTVYAHGATPTATILVRYLVLIAGLLVLLPLLGQPLRLERRFWGHAMAAGCLSSIGSLSLITAFGLIPVSLALLILYLYPILTAILQSLIERRPVSPAQFACLIAAFSGLAISLGAGGAGFAHGMNPLGVLSVVVAAFGFAGFFVWSRYGLAGVAPGSTTLFTSLSGFGFAASVGLGLHLTGVASLAVPGLGDGTGWLAMLAVSICFSVAYFGMSWGVQLIGATPATLLMNLETVFTLCLAALVLRESIDAQRLIGAAVVLSSVLASQVLAARSAAPA